jgi:predicted dehydrogenase
MDRASQGSPEAGAVKDGTGRPGIAVVGAGAWGKNLVRNFAVLPACRLVALCDRDENVLRAYDESLPHVEKTPDFGHILRREDVDGVVIASIAPTHAALAEEALRAGFDVFVEKPLALTAADGERICRLAEERGKILMVGHLLLHHPAVLQMLEIVRRGDLGDIRYATATRVNLGTIRGDENALWSLGPHDLSVLSEIFADDPLDVSARGAAYLQRGIEDVVFLSLRYPGRRMAHVHLSWLDPHKERKMTLVGSLKMLAFDDMQVQEKIRIYDKGVGTQGFLSYAESLTLRNGDILIPQIKMTEPLRRECQDFVDCIRTRRRPLTDGWAGLKVVRLLEAAQASLERNGEPVPVSPGND